jgi:hypothetical protein
MFLPAPREIWTSHTPKLINFHNSRERMVQRVSTVAFEGIEARAVDVQVQVAAP